MFSRIATLLPVAALVAVAAAAPNALEARGGSQCTTGSNYCCNTSQSISVRHVLPLSSDDSRIHCSQSGTIFTGILGGTLSGIGLLAGVTCTPVTVVGTGSGGSCSQQSVCCSNNNYVSLHHVLVHRRLAIVLTV